VRLDKVDVSGLVKPLNQWMHSHKYRLVFSLVSIYSLGYGIVCLLQRTSADLVSGVIFLAMSALFGLPTLAVWLYKNRRRQQ